ncbi:hypothetical protein VITFI_CDS0555 [Vitreoscilla filiformis]|uniref:Uncharacterized protein n=1 Tax=Vitreoscilla filiformis TaxID=63 RepID=A0A221KBB1_VITFI|nr:hypothetical protein VITFI_CDS0555 [Vitreoscilla filiformis]
MLRPSGVRADCGGVRCRGMEKGHSANPTSASKARHRHRNAPNLSRSGEERHFRRGGKALPEGEERCFRCGEERRFRGLNNYVLNKYKYSASAPARPGEGEQPEGEKVALPGRKRARGRCGRCGVGCGRCWRCFYAPPTHHRRTPRRTQVC